MPLLAAEASHGHIPTAQGLLAAGPDTKQYPGRQRQRLQEQPDTRVATARHTSGNNLVSNLVIPRQHQMLQACCQACCQSPHPPNHSATMGFIPDHHSCLASSAQLKPGLNPQLQAIVFQVQGFHSKCSVPVFNSTNEMAMLD
jgi:hypothetical protein